jgi:hypothetical protein
VLSTPDLVFVSQRRIQSQSAEGFYIGTATVPGMGTVAVLFLVG